MLLAQRLALPTVRVRVRGGYDPSVVYGRVGEPLRIVFSREETASCSEHVVFPAFGKSAMLPAFEDVTIELLPERAGEYEFTCQAGVLRGRLIVAANGDDRPAASLPEPAARRQWWTSLRDEPRDTVLLGLVAWLCSIPLLFLVSVPFLGWRVGALLVLASLGVAAVACFAVRVLRIGQTASRWKAGGA